MHTHHAARLSIGSGIVVAVVHFITSCVNNKLTAHCNSISNELCLNNLIVAPIMHHVSHEIDVTILGKTKITQSGQESPEKTSE